MESDWQMLTLIGKEVIGSDVSSEKRTWNSLGNKTGSWETRKEVVAVVWARDVAGEEESLCRVDNRFG